MKLLLIACLIAVVSAGTIKYVFENVDDVGYYKVFDFKKNWAGASEYCVSQGGHLATVNSPEEAEVLKKLLAASKVPYYAHIGFSSLEKEGYFVTVEGKDIPHSGYSRWEGGLVTGVIGKKCGAFTPAGELTNRMCDEELPFVCEKDITSDWLVLPGKKSAYKLHNEKVTWAQALEKCHVQTATLAVMNSDKEAKLVTKRLMKRVEAVHVGIHDLYFEAFYSTVDGGKMEESGYNKWVENQPIKSYNLNYVAMNNKGLYLQENESSLLPFICEKHL